MESLRQEWQSFGHVYWRPIGVHQKLIAQSFHLAFDNDRAIAIAKDELDFTAVSIGYIQAGDWSESFISTIIDWNQSEYERDWRRAIKSILGGGRGAVLITSISLETPELAKRARFFRLQRAPQYVWMSEHLLMAGENCGALRVADRDSWSDYDESDEDSCFSRWKIAYSALDDYLGR